MSVYTEPGLKLDFFDAKGRDARLDEEIRYELGFKGSSHWLVVPVGFVTDGVSAPRILWPFMPPWGSKVSKAAIVHDYLIDLHRKKRPEPGFETRKAIDDEFLIAMLAIGVSPFQARLAHRLVRMWSTVSK